MHGPLNVKFAIMHVNIVNTDTSVYIQHVIFISGLYSFHSFTCGGHKTSRLYDAYFRICRVSWKVGMTHRHPHTKQHKIKLGSERTDKFVLRSDLCLINARTVPVDPLYLINPLNAELNPICYLLALLAHHFLRVCRIMVKLLTLRLLMSYIYGAHILDVSRSHTTTHHSR